MTKIYITYTQVSMTKWLEGKTVKMTIHVSELLVWEWCFLLWFWNILCNKRVLDLQSAKQNSININLKVCKNSREVKREQVRPFSGTVSENFTPNCPLLWWLPVLCELTYFALQLCPALLLLLPAWAASPVLMLFKLHKPTNEHAPFVTTQMLDMDH